MRSTAATETTASDPTGMHAAEIDANGQGGRAPSAQDSETRTTPADQPVTITALEAALVVHRDCLKEWQFHAAQRALARLRQAEYSANVALDARSIMERHAGLIADLDPVPDDEPGCLEAVLRFPRPALDVAQRIHARSASLADALAALATRADVASERGRLKGAVLDLAHIIKRRTGADLDGIPARLCDMDVWLERLTHADFAVASTTYDSIKSRVRRVVGLVDRSGKRRLSRNLLSPEWCDLADRVKSAAKKAKPKSARGGIKGAYAKLYPLIGFCHDHDIAPRTVADETLVELQAALAADGCADPFESARNAVYAWERLQQAVPGFPQQTLARLYRATDGRRSHVKLNSLPAPFQADWLEFAKRFAEAPGAPTGSLSAYVVDDSSSDADAIDDEFLEEDSWEDDDDDLPELGEAPELEAHLSPAYLICLKSHVVNAAAIAVKSGRSVKSLRDVVAPPLVERLVRSKLASQRAKNPNHPQKNSTLKNTVTGMLKIARLIEAPEAILTGLEKLRDKVDPHLKKVRRMKDGKIKREYAEHRMGPRHKERIEAMANDVALFNWFRMIPILRERLQAIADEGREPTPAEANDAIALVLHALTRRCPLRRANLARIPVYGPAPWLRMPVVEGGRARLVVPAEFVKNGVQITVDLDPATVEILALYLDHVRPVIAARTGADPDNPYLLPAKGQRHRAFESLNEIFTDRNWRIGGFRLNLHCQRHLAGKIILDRDPTNMVLVQRLLGHKRVSTTERYYTEVNQIFVQQQYHAMLDDEFERLLLAQSHRKRRRP